MVIIFLILLVLFKWYNVVELVWSFALFLVGVWFDRTVWIILEYSIIV